MIKYKGRMEPYDQTFTLLYCNVNDGIKYCKKIYNKDEPDWDNIFSENFNGTVSEYFFDKDGKRCHDNIIWISDKSENIERTVIHEITHLVYNILSFNNVNDDEVYANWHEYLFELFMNVIKKGLDNAKNKKSKCKVIEKSEGQGDKCTDSNAEVVC